MSTAQRQMAVFGVPISIHPSFFLVAAVLGVAGGQSGGLLLVWIAVVLVSVLWHELGHALALRAVGHRSQIHLYAMGGETSTPIPAPLGPGHEILVSLAGPAVGLIVGGVVFLLAGDTGTGGPQPSVWEAGVRDLLFVNVAWGLFNLLPVLPLDGGRVLSALADLATRRRGERLAIMASLGVAAALAVAALVAGALWLALMAGFLAAYNAAALKRLAPRPSQRELEERLADGHKALEQRAVLAAANAAREVLNATGSEQLRARAAVLLFWAYLMDGRVDEAAGSIESSPPGLAPVLPECVVAAFGGSDPAIELVKDMFHISPNDATGAFLGRALVEVGRVDDAVELLDGPRADLLDSDTSSVVGAALFRAGRLEEAAQLGEQSFERHPHPVLGYNVACSWARQGSSVEALAWLGRAVDAGYHDVAQLDSDPDLAVVRAMPEFEQLRTRASLEDGDV